MNLAARAAGLTRTYGSGSATVTALDHVDFDIDSGEFTAIMGPSGSGKSTLMHLMAALDTPSEGEVWIGDTAVSSLADTPLTVLRRERIGFVFQAFNLVPTLTARENVVLPLSIAGRRVDEEWFDRLVDVLGIRDRLSHKPSELSGGQQQRVACARALINRPDIVFADEPTGNLDSTSAAEVLGFLRRSVDEFGQTVVMVTHDAHAASYADRVVFLSDGRIIDEVRGASQDDLLGAMSRIYPRQGAGVGSDPSTGSGRFDKLNEPRGSLSLRFDKLNEPRGSLSLSKGAERSEVSEEAGSLPSTGSGRFDKLGDSGSLSLSKGAERSEASSREASAAPGIYRDGGAAPAHRGMSDDEGDVESTLERSIARRALLD